MTSINNYQCHYTLIKKMMTSKPEDRLRKKGVKTRKYYKWLRWSMKYFYYSIIQHIKATILSFQRQHSFFHV